ncbi:nucleotide exchange factor GrpE [Actinopolymorpha pittospori]|uniref:Protein GrpE n=1 Tax=Actinopolymorpha pittospori TaxID=648752 RepID=A0A927RE05_9ACTN|nr:nucleotide exchange factor GrpE [Actinopolymorpha pittospori]MBE1611629.1 molecular chaperone GrpE [Actinopolymorpha pittospori]
MSEQQPSPRDAAAATPERSGVEPSTPSQRSAPDVERDVSATAGMPDDERAEADALIDELETRAAEYEDLWRRAVADLDNQRKRHARDLEGQRADVRTQLANQWLPVLDNLDRALAHGQAESSAIVEGIQAVLAQAVAMLAGLGFPRQDDEVGATFDPSRHEAIATMPSADVPAGTVLDVVRPGYGEGGSQLRPTGVVVATKAE